MLRCNGTEIVGAEPKARAAGTTFHVKNLFYNVPARRNFLKSDAVEMRHVVDEFQRVAFAHPGISFVLTHQGAIETEEEAAVREEQLLKAFDDLEVNTRQTLHTRAEFKSAC